MGVLEDGESFLLPSHLLEQPSGRLLRPKHLLPEHEHFPINLRPGLLLHLQSIQGFLERHLSLHQVDLRRIESPLSGSRPFRREQFHRPRSRRLGHSDLALTTD